MSEMFESICEKISAYHVFNYLLPGAVFVSAYRLVSAQTLIFGNVIVDIITIYFAGMVLSRIGSLVIEPICKRLHFVTYASHGDFVDAEKKDEAIHTLLQENNTYRTLAATFLALVLIKIAIFAQQRWPEFNLHVDWVFLLGLLGLFLLSFRKQTAYIRSRINRIKS